ncbi:carboxynorspermidine decarboxylase [Geoalkalibacter ferrihydriticus]|uniref:Carboxynorspermidine/carboxyspermidine decarboxylase n=2 Tax=Geoalkalibacter ferrihydriticus TaxID=392333 RepID=A0A0C2DX57_9BACT|nr:carboxynorspermidine decarboxylase [Geoalkalibacter ferrihydriticus]KIH78044.1 carboxynorspermidine decarboxylase [Geoalkalibacter ferrihydriticus DSM 17813]SDM31716.1 carboxynorspermidine decarboxylase [Geoalkalibacter ferrihydriticus]
MDQVCSKKTDLSAVRTPAFVVFEEALEHNLAILQKVMDQSEAHILLALKAFAMHHCFPLLRQTLKGTCASGPHEARLGREFFGGEVHGFAAGYSEEDIREMAPVCDHLVFNSIGQWRRFGGLARTLNSKLDFGLRCNPEHVETEVAIYDPCGPGSRLGIIADELDETALDGISGLHFHTLCQMGADALERTLTAFEDKFGRYLERMSWVNFGGGHHISRPDYDVAHLIRIIKGFKARYPHLSVYLEPGEAVALNAGAFVASVLDITRNHDVTNVILDTSATCHMPDVLEMPYRPNIIGAANPREKAHTYRLGGISCLAGDVIGEYSFDRPLQVGDRLIFLDMAIYSMVKTNTFNGVKLPSIYYARKDDGIELVRKFGYEDFKNRLS